MISAQKIAEQFASIVVHPAVTNGTPAEKPSTGHSAPGSKSEKPETPEASRLKRQKERLQQETARIDKKLKTTEARTAADPNNDPNELTAQVRPVLQKMNIYNMTDKGKTELVPGQSEERGMETYNLYKITLNREAVIDDDIISRMKRETANFESMEWTNKALCVYVWGPYQAPEVETPPAVGRTAEQDVDSAQHIENPLTSLNDAVARIKRPTLKGAFAEFVRWYDKPWARVFFTIASNHENPKAKTMWDVAWVRYSAGKRPAEAQSFMNASPPQGIKGFDLTNLNFVDAPPGEEPEDVFIDAPKKAPMPQRDPTDDAFLTAARQIDAVANDIQDQDPVVAFALDKIADALEKQSAYVSQPNEPLIHRTQTPSSLRLPFRRGPVEVTKNLGQMSKEDTSKWEALGKKIEQVVKDIEPLTTSENSAMAERARYLQDLLKNVRLYSLPA